MNTGLLRETSLLSGITRLIQLSLEGDTGEMMGMLLARKCSSDCKSWLEDKGDLEEV